MFSDRLDNLEDPLFRHAIQDDFLSTSSQEVRKSAI